MSERTKPATVLLLLLLACIASTTVHYADNYWNFSAYPQGSVASVEVTSSLVLIAWLLLTPAGILGYWLFIRGRFLAAYASLAVYSLVGLTTPFHYTEADLSYFAWWRNVSILTDGVAGAAVLAFVVWSALIAREWARPQTAGFAGG